MASLSLVQNDAERTEPAVPTAYRAMRIWLLVVALLVVCMVLVGGATRLTDSGLSITEWAPLLGVLPPIGEAAWQQAFDAYKKIPQYGVNSSMTMDDFRFIYWWEWSHRFLGRFVGLVYALPLAWFWARGHVRGVLRGKLLMLLVLGGMQGVVGWWMVKSGLTDRIDVAPYRLAVHLTLACVILGGLIWVALDLAPRREIVVPQGFRALASLFLALVYVQLFLGALVAGNDAGLVFNTWPLMQGGLWPEGMGSLSPFWHNFFENHGTVQFMHRLGGYVLMGASVWVALRAAGVAGLDGLSKWMLVAVQVQVVLGIATLVLMVPISLALLHQFGMTVLLALAVVLRHRAQ